MAVEALHQLGAARQGELTQALEPAHHAEDGRRVHVGNVQGVGFKRRMAIAATGDHGELVSALISEYLPDGAQVRMPPLPKRLRVIVVGSAQQGFQVVQVEGHVRRGLKHGPEKKCKALRLGGLRHLIDRLHQPTH